MRDSEVVDPEQTWREARQQDLLERHAPGAFLAVAVGEIIMAARNTAALPTPADRIMPPLQLLVAGLALSAWWRLRRGDVPPAEVQRWIGVGLLALGLLLPLEQALTGNGLLAANLGIMLAACGGVILSHRVFGAAALVLIVAWLLAATSRARWDIPLGQQATLLAVALVVAVFVHWNRTNDRSGLVNSLHGAMESGLRDELTGLWNRRGGREVWEVMAAGAVRDATRMWCVFLDVRGLKSVNDRLGHGAGDDLLKAISAALVATSPQHVIIARWGGDEFCLFGVGNPPNADALAQAARTQAAANLTVPDENWDLSPGVGARPADTSNDAFWELVEQADADMYRRRTAAGSPLNRPSRQGPNA